MSVLLKICVTNHEAQCDYKEDKTSVDEILVLQFTLIKVLEQIQKQLMSANEINIEKVIIDEF